MVYFYKNLYKIDLSRPMRVGETLAVSPTRRMDEM